MRHPAADPYPFGASPTTSEIVRVWQDDRSVGNGSAMLYLRWIRFFREYCERCGLDERAQLTRDGACRFSTWYARRHGVSTDTAANARTALYALNRVYYVLGRDPPRWQHAPVTARPSTALLR